LIICDEHTVRALVVGRLHATAAAEREIVNRCRSTKVRLKSQVSGEDMKLMRAFSAMLSTAILSLARSMDTSHLYSRAYTNVESTTERSPRIV
jgi:hypothetical protein